ncbi:hypothetical protein C8R45DRAFT_1107061 [Mycena sanguinolenta]|nr:hypothetical protein C8R45DRAFT_1107061 [Mycena sanguinolenta]
MVGGLPRHGDSDFFVFSLFLSSPWTLLLLLFALQVALELQRPGNYMVTGNTSKIAQPAAPILVSGRPPPNFALIRCRQASSTLPQAVVTPVKAFSSRLHEELYCIRPFCRTHSLVNLTAARPHSLTSPPHALCAGDIRARVTHRILWELHPAHVKHTLLLVPLLLCAPSQPLSWSFPVASLAVGLYMLKIAFVACEH